MEANPLIADPGPEFDPEQAEQTAGAAPVTPLQLVDQTWQPERLHRILRAQGMITHEAIGVGEEDWLWREGELSGISEPLAAVLDKHPVTHAAAGVSDELAVGAVLLEYCTRSIRERSRIMRARKQAAQAMEQGPITGVDGQGMPSGWRLAGEEQLP